MSNQRDIDILTKITEYCDRIDRHNMNGGNSLEALQTNEMYKDAVAMIVLQIGELTTHLTDEFKAAYNNAPWRDIRAMRNVAAHNYGSFDTVKLWETITEDIPGLRQYCEQIVSQYQILEQDSLPAQEPEMTM